ncbi:MAG: thioredoxin-dependent thiol peroxidase [Alphaproteobacteria bacterium]|nr:thioredoxin-dependent thiol peroxidase [Alphaproteobacteria bacterium]
MPALNVGDKAPLFDLPTSGGKRISLVDLVGKHVILYFYPKDDTPGCTQEAKDFRDHIDAFDNAGAIILGVSKDPVKSHDKFSEKYCLPFPLLADVDGTLCDAYGVWVEKSMYGKKYMGIQRATFLIDQRGNIQEIWPKVSVTGHVEAVLKAVQQ